MSEYIGLKEEAEWMRQHPVDHDAIRRTNERMSRLSGREKIEVLRRANEGGETMDQVLTEIEGRK